MAQEFVTQERLDAGRAYLAALSDLGFRPDGAMWAVHRGDSAVQLALVSGLVDRIGPLTMYEALFAAYEKAKTPASFDPWVVSLYSPKTAFGRHLNAAVVPAVGTAYANTITGERIPVGEPWVIISDWYVQPSWIYKLPKRVYDRETQTKGWQRFTREIGLAA